MMFYRLFGMIFYSQKVWGTFQTILEHPLEHKMEVREEQYASINPSQSQGQGILSRGLSQGQVQNQTQMLYVVRLFKQNK